MLLLAEVTGLFDHADDANRLLYVPLSRALLSRQTRRYTVEFEGDEAALTRFLTKVLADSVSHRLLLGEAPALPGAAFILDYGMKAGALDLEKETILRHHRQDKSAPFTIRSLRIHHRVYIFDPASDPSTALLADRFVKDIVNSAIHTWKVTQAEAA